MGIETLTSAAHAAGYAMAPTDDAIDPVAHTDGVIEIPTRKPNQAPALHFERRKLPSRPALTAGVFSWFGLWKTA